MPLDRCKVLSRAPEMFPTPKAPHSENCSLTASIDQHFFGVHVAVYTYQWILLHMPQQPNLKKTCVGRHICVASPHICVSPHICASTHICVSERLPTHMCFPYVFPHTYVIPQI